MKKSFLFVLLFGLSGIVIAKVSLPSLVSDNMVLQQQTKVNIWGWSKPNAAITVTATWGEKANTKADGNGNWIVALSTPVASFTPYSIVISDGEPVTLKKILIGEVWLVSGQSNMEMSLQAAPGDGTSLDFNQILTESSLYPEIRLFSVAQNSATEPQQDTEGTWEISSPSSVKTFSAIGYQYAIQLRKYLNVPVGIIGSYWGGTIIEAWMDAESQKAFTDVNLQSLYDEKLPVFDKPVSLYNGMVFPLGNFTLQGFLWYQGESNVGRYATYGDKMIAMIELWRKLWKNDKLPFYYAEIAPFDYGSLRFLPLDTTKAQINAALLRDQQKRVMDKVSNVGMVSTNDLVFPFERNQIHPANKLGVAKRFSYWALHDTYGFEALSPIGPQYKSMVIDGDKAKLSFTVNHQPTVLKSASNENNFDGFEIAGSDRIFYPANATVLISRSENRFQRDFIVTSDKVPNPVAVRYCYKNFLLGNAIDSFGMPLIPFRNDDW